MASGVFDLLHYGHVKYLEEAKKLGGEDSELVVVVARDATVRKRKGRDPILPEEERRALVEALKPVNKAILGEEDFSLEKVLSKVKPDIVAVGYDQENLEAELKKVISRKGLDIKVVRLTRYCENSSSKIIKEILERAARMRAG
ncbi:MAG: adenylyltransferase/cytidyltransferase family protein [Candidatus Verstraetearchaeota archaeon]|nr:adenylyltransferase/cytidyltransferase family protein [Candidatus Verstraetearchaeota archaeon]